MKKIGILILAAFLLAACGGGAEDSTDPVTTDPTPTDTTAAEEPPTTAETPEASEQEVEPDAPATSDLSPDSINPDEPIDVGELNSAIAADTEAWIGKEVSITGKNDGESVSQVKTGQSVIIQVRPASGGGAVADCKGTEDPPENSLRATVFKGTITGFDYGRVMLEPCVVVE